LTLLTHVSLPVRVQLPFFKKFQPSTQLAPNQTVFLPLFHSLHLFTPQEQAEIDLRPLIEHLTHEHYI
jgi:hypothetical protein